jgi:leucyl aminopeptidase
MRVRVSQRDLAEVRADLAVGFAFEGQSSPAGVSDPTLRAALEAEMRAERFTGQPTDLLVWNKDGSYGARRFAVIGLGKPRAIPGEAIRLGAARAARAASRFAARRLALRLPPAAGPHVQDELRAAVEGAMLGAYQFERHLTDKSRRIVGPDEVELAVDGAAGAIGRAAEIGSRGAAAVCLARDLVNEGPSRMNPTSLAREAVRQGRAGGLRVRVHTERELRSLGMNALLAVARGSSEAPRVVHLHYRPKGRPRARVVLVGKGVTFDSGGLDLKTSEGMFTMKADMAGAATVLSAMTVLRDVGCRVEVHGLLGLVENMTGPAAYKPGDILDTFAGKTVEVGNTDAEGRLVLCDLLAYACARLAPTLLVDFATLTGACVVALGMQAAGVFSRHDDLVEGFLASARRAGEKMWRLPLYEEYLQPMQQGPSDLRSTGGRWGGAITAALFLGEFVPRDVPWMHVDIAGPAYTEQELPEARVGGTGAGVLTLLRWLESQAAEPAASSPRRRSRRSS